jgi:hypothetical protein
MHKRLFTVGAAVGCAVLTTLGCSETRQNSPLAPAAAPASTEAAPQADRMLYQVRLKALGDSHSNGVMLFEIVGGEFTARVHAAGVEPNARIPQHIHVNPTCNPGGGVLINLDQNLTVAGEAPSTGAAFPLANNGGVVNYEASRSLADLITAVRTYIPAAAGVQTVDDLLAFLNLEQRNAHMHVAFGPPFPAVNCGELNRIN